MEEVKEIRKRLDTIGLILRNLRPVDGFDLSVSDKDMGQIHIPAELVSVVNTPVQTTEINNAERSIFMSKAWLGKVLQYCGTPSPYPKDGERHSVKDIEATADRANQANVDFIKSDFTDLNHIEIVDMLRQAINVISESIEKLNVSDKGREAAISRTNAWNYCVEARLHLGFELERIRETNA